MSYQLRITPAAQKDIERLFEFLAANDISSAIQARAAIEKIYEFISFMPFTCRKTDKTNPFLREALVLFGAAGYVMLFEIDSSETVTVLAVRHQRENDFLM